MVSDREHQWGLNNKVEGILSVETCAMACSEIEGCKGTFWKKQDAT